MGERPNPTSIGKGRDSLTGSSSSIQKSLELAAMSTAARGLLEGTAPQIIGGDERVGDPLGLERSVSSIVFGPSQSEIIPAGSPRLVVSMGLTESKGKQQERLNSNSGSENGTRRRTA